MSRKDLEADLEAGLTVTPTRRVVSPEVAKRFEQRVVAAGKGVAGEDPQDPVREPGKLFSMVEATAIAAAAAGRAPVAEPAEAPVPVPAKAKEATPPKAKTPRPSKKRDVVISQPLPGAPLPETGPGTKRNPRQLKRSERVTRFTTIHFETSVLAWLGLAAQLSDTTMSYVCEQAVVAYLEKSGIPHPDAVAKLVKKGKGG